jgi:RHS repeat-associated protein
MLAVPQSDADWLWPYRPRCVTAFDVTTGVMQGEVVDYYQRQTDETRGSDDAMYPYERDLAEASPLARVSAAGRPGANFGVGSGNALTVRHGPTEASNALLTRLGLPSGSLAARTTTPPSGTPTVELFDSSGRPVAGSVGSGADMHITTTRTAFAGGCATVVDLPPAAFALDGPPDASNPYARVAALDFVRLPVTATSSDHGVCNTICDIAGRIRFTQTSDANGATALRYFKYDGLDRLVEGGSLDSPWDSNELQILANDPSYPPSGDASATWAVRYTWDVPATGGASHPKGRLCQSVKRTAALGEVTETFLYDAYGNVTSATLNVAAYDASTRTITCTYDLLGNITQIVYPPGPSSASLTAQYTYSRLGRTADVGVTGNAARFAAYTYDIHGRIAAVSLNAGKIARTCVYGFQDQLVRVEDRVGSTVLFREDLGYVTSSGALLDGRIAQTSFSGSAVPTPYSYAYQYNPVGWLLGATSVAVGSLGIAEDEALNVGPLAYDAQGNLLGGSAPHGAWSMNPAPGSDRVGSVTTTRPSTTSSTFQYTPDGKVSASDKVTAAYEPLDPLPQTLTGGTTTVTLGYNARQQRVFREVAGARRLYVRGPNAQPLAELTSASASYQVYGPDGLIALVQSGATISVLRDHEGSTRALVGSTGTVLERFSYEPFGALLPGSSTPSHTRRLYTGQEYDAEVDLYAFEARLYDPNLAVCYATDPADEGYSPYTYVQNDPVNRVDPDGRVAGWVASFARAMRRVGDNIAAMNADHPLIIVSHESWDTLTAAYALARREGIPYSNILVIPPLNADQTLSYNLRHNGTVYLVMHGTPDGRIVIGPGAGETMNGMNFFDHLRDHGLMRRVRQVVSDSCYGAASGADGANSFIDDFRFAWETELGNALGRQRLALASGADISITGSRGVTRYSFFFAGERSVVRPWHGTIATYLRNAEMEGGRSTIAAVVPG